MKGYDKITADTFDILKDCYIKELEKNNAYLI